MFHRVQVSDLSAELEPVRHELDRLAEHIGRFASHSGDPDQPVSGLVVMELRHYYTGLETVLTKVARLVDGKNPKDPHELVALLADDVRDLRPALIDGPLSAFVLGLHAVRDAYRAGEVRNIERRDVEHFVEQIMEHHAALQARFDRLYAYLGAHPA